MIPRRRFLAASLLTPLTPVAFANPEGHRAAIIGHTGGGNYGHAIDRLFTGLENVRVVAVADPVENGAKRVAALYPEPRPNTYADFRDMLAAESPTLVAVAPRWSEPHHAMALAALQAGAHVFLEKPFTETPAQADELLAEAKKRNLKIAVAHQMVFDPNLQKLHPVIRDQTLIGELVEIRLYGKMDHRAGGEDLIVLGTHLFDMALWFADSTPAWCHARVLEGDRPFEPTDVRRAAREKIGPLVGTHIHAHFGLHNGIDLTFQSRPELKTITKGWGLELIGTKDRVRIFLDHPTHTYFREKLWPAPDAYPKYPRGEAMTLFNRLTATDWLAAIAENRAPVCSGQRAAWSVEMIHAVFASGRARQRVRLPLPSRNHALE